MGSILCGLYSLVQVVNALLHPVVPRATRGVINGDVDRRLEYISDCAPGRATGLFPHLSTRGILNGVRTRRGTGTRTRGIMAIGRVNVSSFTGIRLATTGVISYRTIGGTGGLLGLALGSNGHGHAITSNVTGFCGPRRLVNGAIVLISGLGGTALYNVRSRNVVLTTSYNRSSVGIVFLSNVPTNDGVE